MLPVKQGSLVPVEYWDVFYFILKKSELIELDMLLEEVVNEINDRLDKKDDPVLEVIWSKRLEGLRKGVENE